MTSHAKKIKETLGLFAENGMGKVTGRNTSTSGYSSLTDSQLFFTWYDNSQNNSQDTCLSSRNSQQSVQEGSDPKFYNSYHTKPLLFGDLKDKTKMSGLLDKFGEEKRKARENVEFDFFIKESQHFKEALTNIQQLISNTERTMCQAVSDKIENFASTLQNSLKNLQIDVSQKFEMMVAKANSQKEFLLEERMMKELEERMMKSGDVTTELSKHFQSLKNSLDDLRKEQDKSLEEVRKLLCTLASGLSAKVTADGAMDCATQTSPTLEQPVSKLLHVTQPAVTQPTCSSDRPGLLVRVSPSDHSLVNKQKGQNPRCLAKRKRRPLVHRKTSRNTVSNENRHAVANGKKSQRPSAALREHHDPNTSTNQCRLDTGCRVNLDNNCMVTPGHLITPLNSWSQDSSDSDRYIPIEPFLEKLTGRASVTDDGFWQLFDAEA